MELKDVIQYYIGCRCFNTWFPKDHPEYNKGWVLMGIVHDSDKQYGLESENEYTWTDSIKPILRKLEDVTDEEWIDIETKTDIHPGAIGIGNLKNSFFNTNWRTWFHWSIVNQALTELRKRHVDVDGLIDAGIAVDLKTLK